jgi:hypothetical protein
MEALQKEMEDKKVRWVVDARTRQVIRRVWVVPVMIP